MKMAWKPPKMKPKAPVSTELPPLSSHENTYKAGLFFTQFCVIL